MPVSFLAPFSAAPSLIKPANGTSFPQTNGGNGANIPVKGYYIIDQKKNVRKLTIPANTSVTTATATSAFTTATSSPSSSTISPPSSASSSSSSSVSTTPLMPCITTTAQHSASTCVDPTSATYLFSSFIGGQSSSITPTKHGIASGASLTNGFVPTQLADIYSGNMLVRKRRKQDLSSPIVSNPGTSLYTASLTNGTSSHSTSNGMTKPTYSFPGAMADLTNTNGPISILSTSLLHHPVNSYNGLVKPILRPLSPLSQPHSTSTSTSMCSNTTNGDSLTNGHFLEPISPCSDNRYMPTSSSDVQSVFSSYNQIENGAYEQNYQQNNSMTQLNPLLMENDSSTQLDDETVQNLSKGRKYVFLLPFERIYINSHSRLDYFRVSIRRKQWFELVGQEVQDSCSHCQIIQANMEESQPSLSEIFGHKGDQR